MVGNKNRRIVKSKVAINNCRESGCIESTRLRNGLYFFPRNIRQSD